MIVLRWLLASALLLTSCAGSESIPAAASIAVRSPPYIYCNVYLQDACFGIAPGDALQMSIPADFTKFSIALSGGADAIIYYGTNPSVRTVVAGEKRWRSEAGDFRMFRSMEGGEEVINYIFAPSRSTIGRVLHIRISSLKGNETAVSSFLADFRSCHGDGSSVICGEDPLFKRPASK